MRYVQELHLHSLAWQLEVCLFVRLKEFVAKYVQLSVTKTMLSKVLCSVVGWFVQ